MSIQHISEELQILIDIFPVSISDYILNYPDRGLLIEVVMDLGRLPEVRFSDITERIESFGEVSADDLADVVGKLGAFNLDNRAGLERTLHRISAIRNREGDIIGLTCRIGRAVQGTISIIRDLIEDGQNCLFLGPPGVGKTTLLRETARVLSDESFKRVVVVDTSNEIAGDGDIPHPAIGYARRMQVPSPDKQHAVMIEAVENHMPEVIIVDELGTEQEIKAAKTIAERGVQLVATAHGYNLENIIKNPTLSELLGGVQTVVIGDEEAKFRGTSKSVLERKSLPTFDVLVEVRSRDTFAIYNPVAQYVDDFLIGDPVDPDIRNRDETDAPEKPSDVKPATIISSSGIKKDQGLTQIFSFGINMDMLSRVIHSLEIPAEVVTQINEADVVLASRSQMKSKSKLKQMLQGRHIPVHVVSRNAESQIKSVFRHIFNLTDTMDDIEREAMRDVEKACEKVQAESRVVELFPQAGFIRKIQHKYVLGQSLNSMSVGEEPNRRVRIYPRNVDKS